MMTILSSSSTVIIQSAQSLADYRVDNWLVIVLCIPGSLLVISEEDELFELVARGVTWQLSGGEVSRRSLMLKAARALLHTAPRMLAVTSPRRFPAFLHIALLLACHSDDYCNLPFYTHI